MDKAILENIDIDKDNPENIVINKDILENTKDIFKKIYYSSDLRFPHAF